jgi:hypothetical protein
MTREFDSPIWEKSRLERAERMDIDAARRLVVAGRVERVAKPGRWRVYLDAAGRLVTEIFGGVK